MSNNAIAPKALVVCNHPGSANVVLPVVEKIMELGFSCSVITSRENMNRFTKMGIKCITVVEVADYDSATRIFRSHQPDFVLLGTSVPDESKTDRLEAIFTAVARKEKKKCVAILDHWTKYKNRFGLSNVDFPENMPDIICVMDDVAKKEMIAEGFSEDCLKITGNPHWDTLKKVGKDLKHADRAAIKKKNGISEKEHLLLFISQPLSKDADTSLGYTEFDVLSDLLRVTNKIKSLSNIIIGIKMHPREESDKYNNLVKTYGRNKIRVFRNVENVYWLGVVSDSIIGMFSSLLVEFSLLGLGVISYQPNVMPGTIIHLGVDINIVNNPEQLICALEGKRNNIRPKKIVFNSTEKVVDEILKLQDF